MESMYPSVVISFRKSKLNSIKKQPAKIGLEWRFYIEIDAWQHVSPLFPKSSGVGISTRISGRVHVDVDGPTGPDRGMRA